MSLTSRLFRALRANVGHAVRRLTRETAEPEIDPDLFDPPPGSRGGVHSDTGAASSQTRASPTGARGKERATLEKAYRALELPYGADPEAIRKAHRSLLRRYHPDRFANDPERLADATRLSQELTAARDTLLEAFERGRLP